MDSCLKEHIFPSHTLQCPVCHRIVYARDIVKHHWIPKKWKKSNNHHIIEMCNTCHRFIHTIIPVEHISHYPTPESFQRLPEFRAYLDYIATVHHPHTIPLKKLIPTLSFFQRNNIT